MIKKKSKQTRVRKVALIDKEQIKKLALAGWTDQQMADFFNITRETFNDMKRKDPQFYANLQDWKAEADEKVERSLLQRALGYDYEEVTYEKSNVGGLGMMVKVDEESKKAEIEHIKHTDTYKTKIVTKKVIPDVTAQIFWLKNRKPKDWRDKFVNLIGDTDDDEFCDQFFGFKRNGNGKHAVN